MSDRDPLTGTDNAWRRMGTADNLTTITGVLTFDDDVGYEELCDRLDERLLRFDRFRQTVRGRKRRLRRPYWEAGDDFDIETHVNHVALPEPQDEAAFQRFVSGLMSRPLDERRPLWEAYLVDGAGAGGGNAVVFRINHSIGDGFALLYILLGLVDDPDAIDLPMGITPDPPSPDEFREDARANGGTEVETASAGTEAGAASPEATAGESDGESGDDSGLSLAGGGVLDSLRLAAKGVTTAVDVLTMADEVDTSFRGDLGTAKRAGWTDEIPLERIRAIGDAHDATVNDVLLAVLAGAFRRVLAERGESPDEVGELRVTVPVNLVPMDARDGSLGNYFGLAFVPLPVGTSDLAERVRIVHERMDEERAGIQAYLMYQTLTVGGLSPDPVLDRLLEQFEDQATGVVTNVPGPTDTLEFLGREVTDVMFWVPQANDQGLGISIFSYDGGVRIGVAGDANLLPDPNVLSDAYEDELQRLFESLP